MAFEQIYGPLLLHERIDAAAARIMWAIASAAQPGRTISPDDFMPKWDAAAAELPEQTPEQLIGMFRSIQQRARSKSR